MVPLTGITGCPDDPDGKCPLDTFVSAMQTIVGEIDWAETCGNKGEFGSKIDGHGTRAENQLCYTDIDFAAPTVNGSPAR